MVVAAAAAAAAAAAGWLAAPVYVLGGVVGWSSAQLVESASIDRSIDRLSGWFQ
jgi:hypothetical protein